MGGSLMAVIIKGNVMFFYDKSSKKFYKVDLAKVPKHEINVNDCPADIAVELVNQAWEKGE